MAYFPVDEWHMPAHSLVKALGGGRIRLCLSRLISIHPHTPTGGTSGSSSNLLARWQDCQSSLPHVFSN